jgi:hypothetical protein
MVARFQKEATKELSNCADSAIHYGTEILSRVKADAQNQKKNAKREICGTKHILDGEVVSY